MIADYEGDVTNLFNVNIDGELPILATRNIAIFPGVISPVIIGRKQSLNLLDKLRKHNDAAFAVFCQKDQEVENPEGKDLFEYGVYAKLVKVLEMPGPGNNLTAIIQGLGRCRLKSITRTMPFMLGEVCPAMEDMPKENDKEFATAMEDMRSTTLNYIRMNEDLPDESQFALNNISNNVIAVDFVCTNLPFSIEDKELLISTGSIKERVIQTLRVLHKEMQLLELKQNIRSKTREDLDEQQREYFLQQQIKNIKEELGGGEGSPERKDLEEKAKSKAWPEEVDKIFRKELDKLDMFNPQSPEYSIQYNYLQTMTNLPWGEYTKDNLDLKRAQRILNHDHYGMEKVKERILEYMAVLMTSVVEMPNKVAEYISVCRQMGIRILPPDINHGVYGFSVDNGSIRYALSAIKSIGRPVIEGIVREREEHGEYTSLKTFIERNIDQINKRVVENLIKAGALDCLEGNRNQKMTVYTQIIDSINQDKKHTMAGQLSLFDIAPEEDKKEFEIRMPQAAEYPKEMILTFEKEVLGIYLSGHPLERYRNMMEKMISAKTSDFQPDDETGIPEVYDNQKVIVGGMITDKTIKYTKNNKVMAFLTVEDLVGTVEVVVFPRDYEKCQMFLNEDARLFIQGRVSAEDDKASKLILEKVRLFDDMPRELWLQFESREEYAKAETGLVDDLMESRGNSTVVIYLKDVKAMKKLPPAYQVHIEDPWLERMCKKYGSSNVKIVERVLKNL